MKQTDTLEVLFVSGLDGDTRRYRCSHQQEQLALQGVTTGFYESDDPQLLASVLDYDVLVLHRVPYSQLIGIVIDLAHLCGKPVVFETDDLVFAPELYEHVGFVDTLSAEDARNFRNDLGWLAETFQQCDCVLTTTDFLADEARRRGKPAYVNRNAPSSDMVRISEQALSARRRRLEQEQGNENERPIVVAYFSGTGSHDRDFQIVAESLVWVLETYPQVQLHIGGHLNLEPELDSYLPRIRRAPYVTWRELPYLVAEVDVNLAPLELDNPFCQAKSEIKFVEAALVGVPTIASPVDAYAFAITDGKDGILAGTPREWRDSLQELLDNPVRRREMGEAARRTAYARYMPEHRAPVLLATLETIISQHGSSPASHEQVLRAMADGMVRYAGHLHSGVLDQAARMASLRDVLWQYADRFKYVSDRLDELRDQLAARDQHIEQRGQAIEHQRQTIEQREQTIEAIMQGRVMRLMTGAQRWLRRIRRG